MSAPLKPWERRTQGGTQQDNEQALWDIWNSSNRADGAAAGGIGDGPVHSSAGGSTVPGTGNTAHSQGASRAPPPLPPRPSSYGTTTSGYGMAGHPYMSSMTGGVGYGYGSGLGYGSSMGMGYGSGLGYGYGGLGSSYGYGGYGGGYGAYGGMSRYGYGAHPGAPGDSNDFIRLAEESSRQAFQSIESIVHAFASVSMMLESTYFAVYSSFRAVLGVADHFSRLRNHLAHVLASLSILRTLQWFLRRIMALFGLMAHPNHEDAWSESQRSANALNNPLGLLQEGSGEDLTTLGPRSRSSWPIMIFFAVVLGTPYVIWRLLSSISGAGRSTASSRWMLGEGDHFTAVALYDFQTERSTVLPFIAGQEIRIAPRDLQPRVRGWLLASVDGRKTGLIPSNYVRITGVCNSINGEGQAASTGPRMQSAPTGPRMQSANGPNFSPANSGPLNTPVTNLGSTTNTAASSTLKQSNPFTPNSNPEKKDQSASKNEP